jgi:hypothetical protein
MNQLSRQENDYIHQEQSIPKDIFLVSSVKTHKTHDYVDISQEEDILSYKEDLLPTHERTNSYNISPNSPSESNTLQALIDFVSNYPLVSSALLNHNSEQQNTTIPMEVENLLEEAKEVHTKEVNIERVTKRVVKKQEGYIPEELKIKPLQ